MLLLATGTNIGLFAFRSLFCPAHICLSICFWFQCVLGPSVDPCSPSGAGEQCVSVAGSSQPVQSARHLLLLLSDGDVHQGPGFTDGSTAGQFIASVVWCLMGSNKLPFLPENLKSSVQ